MLGKYEPCLPTRGTTVPSGPDWIHEIKHDGYRILVTREDKRVHLFSRNGHDWTDRYPWIVEAALKNRQKHFVIDGEAVLLGVDGSCQQHRPPAPNGGMNDNGMGGWVDGQVLSSKS